MDCLDVNPHGCLALSMVCLTEVVFVFLCRNIQF